MFLQCAQESKKVAVWLRIPKFPLELYNATFLARIGSSIGSMLKIDKLTIHSKGQFARICVEVDLEKPLVSHIVVRGYNLLIEYEGLHLICFSCGKYGHKVNQCPEKVNPVEFVRDERKGKAPLEGVNLAVAIADPILKIQGGQEHLQTPIKEG